MNLSELQYLFFFAPCTDVPRKIMHKIITCYLNLMRQGPLQMSTVFVGLDSLAAMWSFWGKVSQNWKANA